MIVDALLFPLYTLFLTVVGLGFFFLSTGGRFDDQLDGNVYFYPLAGLFSIGMTSMIINFFAPVTSPVVWSFIAMFFGVGLVNLRSLLFRPLLWLVIFSAMLSPMAASMNPGYDAGLYHLPHQLWLRNEKIVFGLANFHGRFGFGSILEYIQAPLWIHDNLKLLSYNIAVFFVAFLLFLKQFLDTARRSDWLRGYLLIVLVLVGLIFNFYLMNWSYGYTDVPAGLLFAMTFLVGLRLLYFDFIKSSGQIKFGQEVYFLGFLGLFAFTMKLSAAFIGLWLMLVAIYLLWKKQLKISTAAKYNLANVFFFSAFVVKNLVTTGCLLYPLAASCIPVSWNARTNAVNDANWITAWARHPKSGLSSLESWSWLWNWWIPNRVEHLSVIAFTIFLAVFIALVTRYTSKYKEKGLGFIDIAAIIFILSALGFWFANAPTPRFGIGIFILLGPVLAVGVLGNSISVIRKIPNWSLLVLFLFVAVQFGDTHLLFGKSATDFDTVKVRDSDVVADKRYGTRPQEGDQCWLNFQCAPYNRPEPIINSGYMFFIPGKPSG